MMSATRLSNDEKYAFELVKGLQASYSCANCHQFLGKPYQNVECGDRFCSDCVQLVTNGAAKCPECSTLMSRETTFVDRAFRRELCALEVWCPFKRHGCEEKLLYKSLSDHVGACSKKPVGADASAYDVSSAATTALERRVDKLEKAVEDLQRTFDGVNNQVSSLVLWESNNTMSSGGDDVDTTRQIGEMDRRLQTVEEIAQRASLVHGSIAFDANAFESQLSRLTISLQDIFTKIDCHEQTSHDGNIVWKIDNFQKKKNDCVVRSVYSSPFYSHRHGYKMCARAYLNGNGIGRGEYLSLFLVLMKGEYDALLDFPFPLRVKFTLMDQDSRSSDLSHRFDSDPTLSNFQRPTSALNVGAGYPDFARHRIVETPTYLKDDCIYLRISVGKD